MSETLLVKFWIIIKYQKRVVKMLTMIIDRIHIGCSLLIILLRFLDISECKQMVCKNISLIKISQDVSYHQHTSKIHQVCCFDIINWALTGKFLMIEFVFHPSEIIQGLIQWKVIDESKHMVSKSCILIGWTKIRIIFLSMSSMRFCPISIEVSVSAPIVTLIAYIWEILST